MVAVERNGNLIRGSLAIASLLLLVLVFYTPVDGTLRLVLFAALMLAFGVTFVAAWIEYFVQRARRESRTSER